MSFGTKCIQIWAIVLNCECIGTQFFRYNVWRLCFYLFFFLLLLLQLFLVLLHFSRVHSYWTMVVSCNRKSTWLYAVLRLSGSPTKEVINDKLTERMFIWGSWKHLLILHPSFLLSNAVYAPSTQLMPFAEGFLVIDIRLDVTWEICFLQLA